MPVPKITALDPVSGPAEGGTNVVVSGEQMATVTHVVFGDQETLARDKTDFAVNVSAPKHAAGAVKVFAKTPKGISNTLDFEFL